MRKLAFIAFSALLAIPAIGSAHPRMTHAEESRMFGKSIQREAYAYAGEPKVRIRGVSDSGLTPMAFADWLAGHPHANPTDVNLRKVANRTKRLNRTAPLFVAADINRNGRVSPVELAKFVMVRNA